MKLPESKIYTESHGVISTTAFGVSEDDIGILLNILRTKIYKNPIQALCREISCNARDAHREVHSNESNPTTNLTPIEIYLPNEAEPTLEIKDFGPGISPDRKDIFVKFGKSTKRHSNEFTGAWGLGCKSPFAYSQSFTVVTTADAPIDCSMPRMKYIYNAYIDETQTGTMDLMRMEPTDEPLSTSIIVPVKSNDFKRFEDTIIECTKHWRVKPVLFGGDPDNRPKYPQMTELWRGTNWVMYTEGVTYPCAIVDGIEYPIDKYSVNCKTDLQREMLSYGFCIEFGVGELSLAASRDHLNYDDNTVATILTALDKVAEEVKEKVVTSITEAPSFFEAVDKYRGIKKKVSGIIQNLGGLTWQGHKLRVTCNIKDIGKWARLVCYGIRHGNVTVNRSEDKISFNDSKVLVVHNDKTSHINKHAVAWLFTQYPGIESIQAIYCPEQPTSAAFKEMQDKFGDSQTIPIEYDMDLLALLQPVLYSSIQIPKTKYLTKSSGGSNRVVLEDGNINGYTIFGERVARSSANFSKGQFRLKTSVAQFPRDDGGVFVVYDYKEQVFQTDGRKFEYEDWRKAKDILGEDIIALSPRRAMMVADDPNWAGVHQVLKERFAPWEKKMSGGDLLLLMTRARYAKSRSQNRLATRLAEIDNQKSPLILWAAKEKELREEAEAYKDALGLYRWFGHSITYLDEYNSRAPTLEYSDEIVKLYGQIDKWYPLLKQVSGHDTETMDSMIEYINMMDRYRSETLMKNLIGKLSVAPQQVAAVV